MKKIISLLGLVLILTACSEEAKKESTENLAVLTVDQLLENPEKYVDQNVKVSGTVVHVCKHGGKRVHLIGTNDEEKFKVEAGKDALVFDRTLEGSDITAEGKIMKQVIDEAYLNNWESELNEELEKVDENHKNEKGVAEKIENKEQIKNMRKELEESGKTELIFYSMKCSNYDVKNN